MSQPHTDWFAEVARIIADNERDDPEFYAPPPVDIPAAVKAHRRLDVVEAPPVAGFHPDLAAARTWYASLGPGGDDFDDQAIFDAYARAIRGLTGR